VGSEWSEADVGGSEPGSGGGSDVRGHGFAVRHHVDRKLVREVRFSRLPAAGSVEERRELRVVPGGRNTAERLASPVNLPKPERTCGRSSMECVSSITTKI
jgi:hypothetical protein